MSSDLYHQDDSIVALATPSGRGGIGIVRVSGRAVPEIISHMIAKPLSPRQAVLTPFLDFEGVIIDLGIALLFKAPNSFTGEDVLEFQCHGGPVVLERIVQQVQHYGVRLAQPGEFSYRSFCNGKQDLLQLEASCDLIHASSEQAARMAVASLQGDFSHKINNMIEQVISMRVAVECAIDFSDEDIDQADLSPLQGNVKEMQQTLASVLASAERGARVREGIKVVIVGAPNVGKSSLLNELSGYERAIVTEVAGTTRDVIQEELIFRGISVQLVDTAGIRDSDDCIEKEGMRRGFQAMHEADRLLWVVDARLAPADMVDHLSQILGDRTTLPPFTLVVNKMDLINREQRAEWLAWEKKSPDTLCWVSVKNGDGLDILRLHINQLGEGLPVGEAGFIARARHVDALYAAQSHLGRLTEQLQGGHWELMADDLSRIQQSLSLITGRFVPDDLLEVIFKSFCIGK